MVIARTQFSTAGVGRSVQAFVCIGFGLSLLLTGCGSDEGLGRVSGVVKLDGEPLPEAMVEFTPVNTS